MAKQLTRKDLLKISSNLMKEEKRKQKEFGKQLKFKFNVKKTLYKSLFIVLAFAMMVTILIPFTTDDVKPVIKITAWTIYTTAFVCTYAFFIVYMYVKERNDFLAKNPLYIKEKQAHIRYEKAIKQKKIECKLQNIKFTRKMREDIQLEIYSIKVNTKEEPDRIEDAFIPVSTAQKIEHKLNKVENKKAKEKIAGLNIATKEQIEDAKNENKNDSINLEATFAPSSMLDNDIKQMFPKIPSAEVDKALRFGTVRRYKIDENGNEIPIDENGKELEDEERN